jgi:LysR family hydrogen peroxide-inducible transcriptional activator
MNLQQIEYIVAVNELKHFGLAAEKCFVTQSTLSTMIGKLEHEIGIQIFDRKTKPIAPTKEGKKLIEKLLIILKDVENFREEVKILKGELSGDFKIGVIPTVAPYILPKFLSSFTKKYPNIHFSISELTTESIVSNLKKRELDIGILALPLNEPNLLEYPIYNEEFVLYDCDFSNSTGAVVLEDIDYERFWLLEDGHCFGNQVIKVCNVESAILNKAANFDFKAGSIDSLIRFVKENKGNTLLPYLATLDFLETEKLNLSFFNEDTPVRNIGIATHKHFVKKPILEFIKIEILSKIEPHLNKIQKNHKVISPY